MSPVPTAPTSAPGPLAVLDAMPPLGEFYAQYWNKRPFLARGAIAPAVTDGLITPDELAGLSMEEAVRSRMVTSPNSLPGPLADRPNDWQCRFGPFAAEDFDVADVPPWSLLVQNVEQFHPGTAALLRSFDVAPRWLMDDIMVSFSTKGGTIGGHIDSYHVFLVQGQGARRWTIGREPTLDEVYIDGLDLKILKDPVDGDPVAVTAGDVLYVPPHFAHEGVTLDDALTFSVGFLGPKLSELYGAYGQYLAENDALDSRYIGGGLGGDSAGFALSADAVAALRDHLGQPLNTPAFSEWLAGFFTGSTNEDIERYSERDNALDLAAFAAALQAGAGLIKPAHVKFALTPSPGGNYSLGFDGETFAIDKAALAVILGLMKEEPVTADATPGLRDHLDLLRILYNHQALEFGDSAPYAALRTARVRNWL